LNGGNHNEKGIDGTGIHTRQERLDGRLGERHDFLGANIDAVETAARLGIDFGHAQNYHADSEGSALAHEAIAQATVAFRERNAIPEDWNARIEADYKSRGGRK
jgi:hypothetical protein